MFKFGQEVIHLPLSLTYPRKILGKSPNSDLCLAASEDPFHKKLQGWDLLYNLSTIEFGRDSTWRGRLMEFSILGVFCVKRGHHTIEIKVYL